MKSKIFERFSFISLTALISIVIAGGGLLSPSEAKAENASGMVLRKWL